MATDKMPNIKVLKADQANQSADCLNNRLQRPELVQQLTKFVLTLQLKDLPDSVVEAANIFTMDSMAVGVAATTYLSLIHI